jgi:hypothetical protein
MNKAVADIALQSDGQSEKQDWRQHIAVHPICDRYPLMSLERLRELADDIAAVGIRDEILTCRTKQGGPLTLIEGRDRLNACQLLGWPIFDGKGNWSRKILPHVHFLGVLTGDQIRSVVRSKNYLRKHLTESQRAMIAAEDANMEQGRPITGTVAGLVTQAEAAEEQDVSERLVRSAKRIKREAPAEAEKIKRGEKSIAKVNRELQKEKQPRKSPAELARNEKWKATHQLEWAWEASSTRQRSKFLKQHCGELNDEE